MLSQRFATPLRLRVEHSPRLRVVVTTFFLLCTTALFIAQQAIWLKLLAMLGLIITFMLCWQRRPELGGEAVELILRPNGAWLLERKGESIALQLHGQSTVSPWLLLLCFKEMHGRRHFDYLLWQAEQPSNLFRRLRVYLRLYAADALR